MEPVSKTIDKALGRLAVLEEMLNVLDERFEFSFKRVANEASFITELSRAYKDRYNQELLIDRSTYEALCALLELYTSTNTATIRGVSVL